MRGSVFVNCPFDDEYRPIFDAIVFSIVASDFSVRSALEVSDGGEPRIEKIFRLIGEATHSIHDLSRVELDAASGLPRFNMPIELGIALGHRRFARRSRARRPKLLILDRERYRYQKFASDLAGMDIAEHRSDPFAAIACVRAFLSPDNPDLPTEDAIQELYRTFTGALPDIAKARRLKVDQLRFLDRLRLSELFVDEVRRNPSA